MDSRVDPNTKRVMLIYSSLMIDGVDVMMSAITGVSIFLTDETNASDLVVHDDSAMYQKTKKIRIVGRFQTLSLIKAQPVGHHALG